MKKIIILMLLTVSYLGTGCSDDDNTVNNNILSSLTVDNQPLLADTSQLSFSTTLQLNAETQEYGRNFIIANNATDEQMIIHIDYPASRPDASGSYNFGIGETNEYMFANGSLTIASGTVYSFAGYFVDVNDLGNGRYRLSFDGTEAVVLFSGNELSIVDGYIEANFSELQD